MIDDVEGVHPVANTETAIGADIVFVHGLSGGSHSTWRHGTEGEMDHFFWPKELGNDLPNCRIWTVGYAAGITQLGNPGMVIEQRAGNLATQLKHSGIGRLPVFFICHSMGGLVVKSLIVSSQLSEDPDRKELVANIRAIIFCGTPHRGADLAHAVGTLGRYFSWAGLWFAGILGWTVCDLIGRCLGTQAHGREMETNAISLDLLHDKFLICRQTHQIPIESYAEGQGLFRRRWLVRPLRLGAVVPRSSANPNAGLVHDVDADHLSLVKPPPPSNPIHTMVYRGVVAFVSKQMHRPAVSRSVVRGVWSWLEAVDCAAAKAPPIS